MYCNCPVCKNAINNGGKNVRKRSAILVNDNLCIDYGPDISQAFFETSYNAFELKYLLITHSHFDHFYPENLEIRGIRYLQEQIQTFNIIGNLAVFYKLSMLGYSDEALSIKRCEINLYKFISLDDYQIMAIPANHAHDIGCSVNYIIKANDNTLLYATDTGIYSDEVFEKIYGMFFDTIILDATNLFLSTSKNHLNKDGFLIMIEKLKKNNNMSKNTRVIATHFSHTGCLPHNQMNNMLQDEDIIIGYDDMEIDL